MKAATILATACVVALAASGCGGDSKKVAYKTGGTYTEALTSDPGNLHPLRAVQQTTFNVIPFAYDTLINFDATGRVVSGLAAKWNATATRARFTLRRGITCSDGTKLTAGDVAANFRWIKDPNNKSTAIGNTLPSPDFSVSSDDASRTVTITVPQPYGFLLEGAGTLPIVCPKGLADPKLLAHGTDGTGPFRVTDYVADDHLVLTARKTYRWGPGGATSAAPGFPAKVVFRFIQSESTAANLLLSGQLTSATFGGPDLARLQGHDFFERSEIDGPQDLFFNERAGHVGADANVRKALMMAIDRAQVTKVATEDHGKVPDGLSLIPPRPCRQNTVDGALPAHDPAGAKKLLDASGWTAGAGGMRAKDGRPLAVTLLYPSESPGYSAAMELIAQWWKDLGVQTKPKGQGTNAAAQTLFAGNAWDAAWLSVGVGFPNMFVPFASGPVSPDGQNFAGIRNPAYERVAGQALRTTGAAGCALWRKAEQELFRAADVMPASAIRHVVVANGARLAIGLNGTEPTSIRLLAR